MKCFTCGKPLDAATIKKLVQNGYPHGLCRECADYIKKG